MIELPPWFSSMSVAMNSDVHRATGDIAKVPKSTLPLICFRDGSPPLPDVNSSLMDSVLVPHSNGSFKGIEALQSSEQCYPMQKNFTVKLTNEQINRAPAYSFSANITVEGCTTLTMWGPDCNQTINPLSCALSDSYSPADNSSEADFYNQTIEYRWRAKILLFGCSGVSQELKIVAMDVWLNETSSNKTKNASGINLICFARHGAIPSETVNDYSSNINKSPIVIHFPKVGRWYITILPVNLSKELGGSSDTDMKVCYSMESKLLECPVGKAGANCTREMYNLQTALRKGSGYFESYYLPVSEKVSPDSANFPLDSLLTNYSLHGEPDETWTYFILDIPRGAAGGNIHIRLASDAKINYEIYARFGGLPSLTSWDYYFANKTSSSVGSIYCSCDRDHGGFDCSIELVSHHGHVWQSIFLIASNAAAALPAFWALRQKFMDFWLSFMAVVSTFVYLGTLDEGLKRAVHTAVAILTALMAYTKATRPANIILVMAIGTVALLIGWLKKTAVQNKSF
ncbi:transmembrane protein-related protein [Prunus dulcis]|uniref:Transmembrane protein-related protein n=1 Tax=Prunus dulcis TaxID=3755 RepID=A0A4Y1R0D4_PRUDU|nr:transmembrane protein-related protein [Prunus dulcis]